MGITKRNSNVETANIEKVKGNAEQFQSEMYASEKGKQWQAVNQRNSPSATSFMKNHLLWSHWDLKGEVCYTSILKSCLQGNSMAWQPGTNLLTPTLKCYLQAIHPLQYGYLNVTEAMGNVCFAREKWHWGCIKYL